MQPKLTHPWPRSVEEAVGLQERLRARVVTADRFRQVRRVAGVCVHYQGGGTLAHAAVAVLSFPGLEWLEMSFGRAAVEFPEAPGLSAFRTLPAVLDAIGAICGRPDLFLCDAPGYAHRCRFGLASHLGVLLGQPTIGVTQQPTAGDHDPVPPGRGQWRPLVDGGEVVGAALRTRDQARPVYVSIGHRVSLESAIAFVLAATPRYRLPQPLRQARWFAGGRGAERERFEP